MIENSYSAFTDGSSDNKNPLRPGGSAYIIFDSQGNEVKRMSKGFMGVTNNKMELLAIVSVVNSLPPNSSVTIHSDSQYSINVLSGRWRASENLKVINLYRRLVAEKNIKVTFEWVRGHNGDVYNELCDQMARGEYQKMLGKGEKVKKKSRRKKQLQQKS